jgi:hypothetical protein
MTYRDYLMLETLATEWETEQTAPLFTDERGLGDDQWTIKISKQS